MHWILLLCVCIWYWLLILKIAFVHLLQSQKIINEHIEHRRQERYANPDRFNVKPTLGERSMRRPPPQPKQMTYDTDKTIEEVNVQENVNNHGNLFIVLVVYCPTFDKHQAGCPLLYLLRFLQSCVPWTK